MRKFLGLMFLVILFASVGFAKEKRVLGFAYNNETKQVVIVVAEGEVDKNGKFDDSANIRNITVDLLNGLLKENKKEVEFSKEKGREMLDFFANTVVPDFTEGVKFFDDSEGKIVTAFKKK